jgi:hypothetical protein
MNHKQAMQYADHIDTIIGGAMNTDTDTDTDTDTQLTDLYESLYVVAYVIESLRLEPTINQYRSIFTGSGAYDLAFDTLHKYAEQYDAAKKGEQ